MLDVRNFRKFKKMLDFRNFRKFKNDLRMILERFYFALPPMSPYLKIHMLHLTPNNRDISKFPDVHHIANIFFKQ